MRVDILPPGPEHAGRLGTLTFPRYRPLLAAADSVARVAVVAGAPVGLALGRPAPAAGEVELLSLYVKPEWRRQGIGRRLLQEFEACCRDGGCGALTVVWMSGTPGVVALAALLDREGWSPPQARFVVYRAAVDDLATASWMHAFGGLPAEYQVLPWSELAPEQLDMLRQDLRFEDWVPPDLSPFAFAGQGIDGAPPEPRLSFAATAWGEIAGWHLAHRVDPVTVRFSCTFVRPQEQAQLLILALWREAFQRLAGTGYRKVSWAVGCERIAMLRFTDQAMLPYVAQRSETWGSRKAIGMR